MKNDEMPQLQNARIYHVPSKLTSYEFGSESGNLINEAALAITENPIVYLGFVSYYVNNRISDMVNFILIYFRRFSNFGKLLKFFSHSFKIVSSILNID